MRWVRQIVRFGVAVAAAAALGTLASTHFVLQGLGDIGVQIGFGARAAMHWEDLLGMGPLFAGIVAVGFAIAFPVAKAVMRALPAWQPVGYPLAGAAALVVALLLMQGVLGIMPVAGARSVLGLAGQGVAGALGGFVFAALGRGLSPAGKATIR